MKKLPLSPHAILLLMFLFALIILAALGSCNSTKKTTSKQSSSKDSTVVQKVDSTSATTKDSAGSSSVATEWESEITFNFDTSADYREILLDTMAGTHPYIWPRLRTIIKKERGKQLATEQAEVKTTSNIQLQSSNTATVATTETSIKKDISKKKFPFAIVIGFVIIVVVAIGLWWFFGAPRKKK